MTVLTHSARLPCPHPRNKRKPNPYTLSSMLHIVNAMHSNIHKKNGSFVVYFRVHAILFIYLFIPQMFLAMKQIDYPEKKVPFFFLFTVARSL